jgi:hypothetical protein
MIAQILLTSILVAVLLYAWKEHKTAPIIGLLTALIAVSGLYFVWLPEHASTLAAWAGIGRGADLILYGWSAFSLIALLNLHLKLRAQTELITRLVRSLALTDASAPTSSSRPRNSRSKQPSATRRDVPRRRSA